ncbi:metalloregulator ArsR/SmtB family transcription factor [Frigidibacter sp. SD6-1]|uniref:ArsR/SmtB family transcription factor n=1 Tax=Frigidibacter sp. SD6-1 TaxID=3032581 RepID=UPI0024DF859F|nr:metalloregulator ArsR/SmtB family transcription factor [Frigidibacter sp. SD6-1]
MEESRALAAIQALGHETRLSLVRILVGAGRAGLTQGDLARRLGATPSRLAFHLGLLEQAGLIAARRESRNVFYAADTAGLGRLIGYVLNDCCAAHPEVAACCRHPERHSRHQN